MQKFSAVPAANHKLFLYKILTRKMMHKQQKNIAGRLPENNRKSSVDLQSQKKC